MELKKRNKLNTKLRIAELAGEVGDADLFAPKSQLKEVKIESTFT